MILSKKIHFTYTLHSGWIKRVLRKCQGKLWQSAKETCALAEWEIWLISWLSSLLPAFNVAPPYKDTFSAWKVVHTAEVAPLLLLSKHSFKTTLKLCKWLFKIYFYPNIEEQVVQFPSKLSVPSFIRSSTPILIGNFWNDMLIEKKNKIAILT